MPFSGGINIDNDGVVQTNAVARTYVPLATDFYVEGTLVNTDGDVYTTTDAPQAGDPYINGIRHTLNGVRYINNTPAQPRSNRGGMAVRGSAGEQIAGSITVLDGFQAGIRLGDSTSFGNAESGGRMAVA